MPKVLVTFAVFLQKPIFDTVVNNVCNFIDENHYVFIVLGKKCIKLLIAAKANNALHDREQKFLLDATSLVADGIPLTKRPVRVPLSLEKVQGTYRYISNTV